MLSFRRALRSEAYDCVIDTQGLLKSALVTWQARGTKHGFDAASAREPVASRFYDIRHRITREMHAVERNRSLTASALGVEHSGACDYGLRARDGHPVEGLARYVVLLSMTSQADKLWPEDHWSGLARNFSEAGWESVFPWGSEAEEARCRRIVEKAGAGVVPRTMTLGELSSLISGSQAVVGLDTGLSHLAAALGVPVVGVYCGSDPRLTGLYGIGKLKNLGGPGQVPAVADVADAVRALA
jgi:heptosyltransferase-1